MTLDDIRKLISKDPETKDLVVNDSDLLIVYKYLQIKDTLQDGYKPVLKTEPYYEITYIPTKEQIIKNNFNKSRNYLHVFNSEIYLQDSSLDEFKTNTKERKLALEHSKKFLEDYSNNKNAKGLFIFGKYGTGKTYLLSAIANELTQQGHTVLFAFMPDLVRIIKAGINEGDMESRINQLKQADVLMLDDIGGENMSGWFRDEILLPVIQYRLSGGLPVFFSSNLNMEALMESLSTTRQELDFVKSVRLIQRIRDLTTYVSLNEEQFKKTK